MIKINLLGNETARDNSGTIVVAGYAASLVIAIVCCYFAYAALSAELQDLTTQQQQLETELARLQKITQEVKDLEAKEKEFNDKLLVIAKLKKNKTGPVRVLDDLNNAIPERAWVMGMKEQTGLIRIEGRALDNQTIAGFMKELDASDFFESVELVETKQIEEKEIKIKEFVLNTNVSYTGLARPQLKTEGQEIRPDSLPGLPAAAQPPVKP